MKARQTIGFIFISLLFILIGAALLFSMTNQPFERIRNLSGIPSRSGLFQFTIVASSADNRITGRDY